MDKKLLIAVYILLISAFSLIAIIRFTNNHSGQNNVTNQSINHEIQKKIKYASPINGYITRLTYRPFGKYITGADKPPDCGREFLGFHDADDLEVTENEKTSDVSIYAVADGTIRVVEYVDGYGGLIIQEANLDGQEVTINYGHIRLSSVELKDNDPVHAGEKIAVLGTGCSQETDGERKHLHFAIHKGYEIDLRGYIPTQAELLENWLNPKEELIRIGAL